MWTQCTQSHCLWNSTRPACPDFDKLPGGDVTGSQINQNGSKAVAFNAPLHFKIKRVFSVQQLRSLIQAASSQDLLVLKAIMLLGFFGFYRLSSLVPPSKAAFSVGHFPMHGDIICGPPGAHIVTKCEKSMQLLGQTHM